MKQYWSPDVVVPVTLGSTCCRRGIKSRCCFMIFPSVTGSKSWSFMTNFSFPKHSIFLELYYDKKHYPPPPTQKSPTPSLHEIQQRCKTLRTVAKIPWEPASISTSKTGTNDDNTFSSPFFPRSLAGGSALRGQNGRFGSWHDDSGTPSLKSKASPAVCCIVTLSAESFNLAHKDV